MKKDFHDEEKEKRTVIADSPLSSRLVRDKIFFPSCMHLAYDRYDRCRPLDEEIRHTRCCGIGDRLTEMVGNWDVYINYVPASFRYRTFEWKVA